MRDEIRQNGEPLLWAEGEEWTSILLFELKYSPHLRESFLPGPQYDLPEYHRQEFHRSGIQGIHRKLDLTSGLRARPRRAVV